MTTPNFRDRYERATGLARRIHSERMFLGTPEPHLSYLHDVALAMRFEGASITGVRAAMLHDALQFGSGEIPGLKADIERICGAEGLAMVETCTPPDAGYGAEFLERLHRCDNDDPGLKLFQVVTLQKLKKMHRHWPKHGSAILAALPGEDAHAKLEWFCELAMLFRARRPGPMTDAISRYAQSFRNMLGEQPVAPGRRPAFPFLRRQLYRALGDELHFFIEPHAEMVETTTGAVTTVLRPTEIRVERRQGRTFRTIIDPKESTLEIQFVVRATAAEGSHRAAKKRYQVLSELLEETFAMIQRRCRDAGFVIDRPWGPVGFDEYRRGVEEGTLTGETSACLNYDNVGELLEGLEWVAEGGVGLEPTELFAAEVRE